MDSSEQSATFVPPKDLYKNVEQLLEILKRYGINKSDKHKFPFALLEDKLRCCAAMFSGGEFELTPPFLPSLALDIFEQDLKRIYLSATLQSEIEFIRAFGRVPDVIIEPPFDTAGNGERLILDSKNVEIGFGPEFAKHLVGSRKAIISVHNYRRAEQWSGVARPPKKEEFSKELEEFRSKRSKVGAFILVSRVDGIDLPHDTCRIMIMDGIPSASSLLERYQWERLNKNNVHASRVATRMVQLFGRINRGRNDFGVFLIEGEENRKWFRRKRNLALLPPLLRRQIIIGQQVKKAYEPNTITETEVCNLIDQVLGRDKEWLRYYQNQIKTTELNENQNNQVELSEKVLVEATLSEAKYAAATWNGDFSTAR